MTRPNLVIQDEQDLRWPDWFVVGAYKCGTTALHYGLSQHPDLYLHPFIKETNYFAPDIPAEHRINTPSAYQALFADAASSVKVGEVCPSYLLSRQAPAMIAERIPQAKIIISIRHPVERSYSDFMMHVRDGRCAYDALDTFLEREINGELALGEGILEQSRYRNAIARYYAYFPPQNILVFKYNMLGSSFDRLFRGIFEFLQVTPRRVSMNSDTFNVSGVPKSSLVQTVVTAARKRRRTIKRMVPKPLQVSAMHVANLNLDRRPISASDRRKLSEVLREDIAWYEAHPSLTVGSPA